MQTVVYKGTSDRREFSREDFQSLGIDHFGMGFSKGFPVEVSNEAYGILMGHPALAGEFTSSDEKVEHADPDLTSLVGNPGNGELNPQSVETGIGKPKDVDDESGDDDDSSKTSKAKAKRAG